MIQSAIYTKSYSNHEIQHIQCVTAENWNDLFFLQPQTSDDAFDQVVQLYRDYIVPRYGKLLRTFLLFHLPTQTDFNLSHQYGLIHYYQTEALLSDCFRARIHYGNHRLLIDDALTESIFASLNDAGCTAVVPGSLPGLSILPVANTLGFLSRQRPAPKLCVNASFFTMNPLDITSPFDQIGTTFGLCVKDGIILYPPLFNREAFLLHNDGSITIQPLSLTAITVEIDGIQYRHGENAVFYSRPACTHTPKGGFDLVISGNRLSAVAEGGRTPVPSSGFIIHTSARPSLSEHPIVSFHGLEDIQFGIQCGNSAIIQGVKTDDFRSSFHDIRKPWIHLYPPTFYPMHFAKDRAPRILFGADQQSKPMILWLEGAGKYGYAPGKESCGATLKEAADIAAEFGMVNGIHLDGGGSAQILRNGTRELLVSDRDPTTFQEVERAVSMAIQIQ